MPILSGDIKLLASVVMTDDSEGGGAPSSVEILDGASNSIFPDVSEVDRAGGVVHLRKVFPTVQTDDADTYYGANVLIADTPDDPNVSVLAFKAAEFFEERASAKNRVEAYMNKAGLYASGFLLENHIAGQRSIQICQRPSTAAPIVAQTLYLVQNEGLATEFSQYIRVKTVKSEEKTFTYSSGGGYVDFQALVVTCELTDALRYNFTGSAPNRLFQADSSAARLRTTLVADATLYYGASPVVGTVARGALSLAVESTYAKLVPSAQTETALVDLSLVGAANPMVAAAAGTVSRTVVIASIAVGARYVLPTGCYPGSLAVVTPSGTLSDDGAGAVLLGGAAAGSINYQTGEITLTRSISSGVVTEVYWPAAAVSAQTWSFSREVTAENRAYVWVIPLTPLPGPGTVLLSYMVQGEWYDITDNGAGVIAGSDASYGAGTISYVTGSLNVTLGALPDVGGEIIVSWGSPAEYVPLTEASLAIEQPKIEFDLGEACAANTLHLTWQAGGVTKSATSNASGTITGDASGKLAAGAGTGWIRTSVLPDAGTLAATYSTAAGLTHSVTVSAGTTFSGVLPGAPLEYGSISASVLIAQASATADDAGMVASASAIVPGTIRDDGAGGWTLDGYGALPTSSINYTTGAFTLVLNVSSLMPVAMYVWRAEDGTENSEGRGQKILKGYSASTVSRAWAAGAAAFSYSSSGTATVGGSGSAAISMSLDLLPYLRGTLVSGALRFRLGTDVFVDRAGVLYRAIDPASGAGVEAGTINYASGRATITSWAAGAWLFVLESGIVNPGTAGMSAVVGRTASRPLKSQSFSMAGALLDGTSIAATAAASGALTATKISGTINIETGVYKLAFGQIVGADFVSALADPGTLRYNAVAYSYLPLDADQIGIDPVRLPTDGRVPIFRQGDFAVLGHTASRIATVSNGQTVNFGRTRLSRVRVIGADKAVISTGYSVDLDAGTITFSAIEGYSQPVTLEDRIEDMARISDVQITGRISFTRQISHDYPAGSVLSSALVLGDLYPYSRAFFDQQTWSGAWQDIVSGSVANASYDRTTYPLVLSNRGAVTERWAIVFTNTTTFQVIGEHVGIIATGNISSDLSPINPATGGPYFTLKAAGWGLGWAAGNVLRFNTVGSSAPVWIARTVQQGAETVTDDSFTFLVRGDVNAD